MDPAGSISLYHKTILPSSHAIKSISGYFTQCEDEELLTVNSNGEYLQIRRLRDKSLFDSTSSPDLDGNDSGSDYGLYSQCLCNTFGFIQTINKIEMNHSNKETDLIAITTDSNQLIILKHHFAHVPITSNTPKPKSTQNIPFMIVTSYNLQFFGYFCQILQSGVFFSSLHKNKNHIVTLRRQEYIIAVSSQKAQDFGDNKTTNHLFLRLTSLVDSIFVCFCFFVVFQLLFVLFLFLFLFC